MLRDCVYVYVCVFVWFRMIFDINRNDCVSMKSNLKLKMAIVLI